MTIRDPESGDIGPQGAAAEDTLAEPSKFLTTVRLALAKRGPQLHALQEWALANEDRILSAAARKPRTHAAVRMALALLRKAPLGSVPAPVSDLRAANPLAASLPPPDDGGSTHNTAPPSTSNAASTPSHPLAMSDAGWSPLAAQPSATPGSLADPFEDTTEVMRVELEAPIDATNLGGYSLTLNQYNFGTQVSVSGPTKGLYEVSELQPGEKRQLSDRAKHPIPVVVERVDALTFAVEVHRQMPTVLRMLAPVLT